MHGIDGAGDMAAGRRVEAVPMGAQPDISQMLDAAEAAHRAEDSREVERLGRELIAALEGSDDPRLALGHFFVGVARARNNDAAAAKVHCARALEIYTASDDREGILRVTFALAGLAGEVELDPIAAHQLSVSALQQARELGDDLTLAVALGNFAEVCRQEGDYAGAIEDATESAALYEKAGRYGRAAAQYGVMAQVHTVRRDYAQAIEDLDAAWTLLQREPIARHCAWYFEVWFALAVALEYCETAARLYGFIGHYRAENETQRLPGVLIRLSGSVEHVLSTLGTHRSDDLVEEGVHLTLESAQALAKTVHAPV